MRLSPLPGLLIGLLVLVAVASVAVAIAAGGPGSAAPAPTQQVVVRPFDDGMRHDERDAHGFRYGRR
jgi:hypothetical protein